MAKFERKWGDDPSGTSGTSGTPYSGIHKKEKKVGDSGTSGTSGTPYSGVRKSETESLSTEVLENTDIKVCEIFHNPIITTRTREEINKKMEGGKGGAISATYAQPRLETEVPEVKTEVPEVKTEVPEVKTLGDCHYVDDNHGSNSKEFWRCVTHGWRTTHQSECYGHPNQVATRKIESAARAKITAMRQELG